MPRKKPTPALVALMIGCLCIAGGCASGNFSAASLPAQFQAPPVAATGGMHLHKLAAQGQNSSRIATGDLLELHLTSGVEEGPPKPHMVRVDENGAIDAPLVGLVRVAGTEPAEASRLIAEAAVQRGIYRRPTVAVTVKEQATNKVMVMGAVAEPGLHALPKNASDVLSAIAAAGGLTEEAGTEVEVMRQSPGYLASAEQQGEPGSGTPDGVQQVAYQDPARPNTGPAVHRINLAATSRPDAVSRQLNEHDVVMVLPKEKKVIHVTGLVRRPDQFELSDDQPIRLLDAIAMAGGADSPVADKVIVVRQRPSGEGPLVIDASMGKAKRNGRENLILMPGDLVSVESTLATATVGTLKDFFRITMGVSSRLTAF